MSELSAGCPYCGKAIVTLKLSGKAGAVGLAEPEDTGCQARGSGFDATAEQCQACDEAAECAAETVAAMKASRLPPPGGDLPPGVV